MKSLYPIILALSVIFASCDSSTDTKKSSSSDAQPTGNGTGSGNNGSSRPGRDAEEEPSITAGTTLKFATPAVTRPRRDDSYTHPLNKKEVAGDEGAITYASGNPAVATVNETTGEVTFEEAEGGEVTITARKAGTPKKYKAQTAQYTLKIDHPDGSTIAFAEPEVSQPYSVGRTTYTKTARKTRNVADDDGAITYASNKESIATVNSGTGVVTFLKAGKVTITATKEATPDKVYPQSTSRYTLYITMRPADKNALVDEIKKAMASDTNVDADLNYIDTSAIDDMSELFAADNPDTPRKEGYGLDKFAGNISKWNVSAVVYMNSMFWGAKAFNSDISGWQMNNVTNMQSMFYDAAKFNKDLNAWRDRLNDRIKANKWNLANNMFTGSGLTLTMPNWCDKDCQDKQ